MTSLYLYVVTLAIAAVMLVLVYRVKAWGPGWVSHYFHYLLFFYTGTLAGQVVPLVISEVAAPGNAVMRSVFWLLQATIAFPVSLVALYWFAALAFGLARRPIPRHATVAYFAGALVAAVVFAAWTVARVGAGAASWPPWLYEAGMMTGAAAVVGLSAWAWIAAGTVDDGAHRRFVRWFAVLLVGGLFLKTLIATWAGVGERWHDLLRTALNLPSFVLLVAHVGGQRRQALAAAAVSRASAPDVDLASRLGISRREADVARLVCEGCANKEIAARLGIAPQTVKQHLYSIYQKLHVENRVQLVNIVREATTAAPADLVS